jgi:outer membrane protein OmpU
MNRIFFCAVLCSAATAAHAQSSVQLYGIVDGALSYVSNEKGGRAWTQTGGVGQSDRWGLRGSEDLGGGYHAIFRLENGYTLNDGKFSQGGLEFGRQAYAGLESAQFGTLTLGRQYDFMTTNLSPFSSGSLTPTVFAFHLGDLDRLGGERLNNAARYVTPEFAGLQLGAIYSFGGQAGNFVANSSVGAGAIYHYGMLKLGAAYVTMHNYVQVFGIGTTVLGESLAGTPTLGTLSPPAMFDKVTVAGGGGGYQLGPAYLHGLFTLVDLQRHSSTAVLRTGEGGVKYAITPAFWLSASYAYSKLNDTHWGQAVAGIDYALSKGTDIYFNGVYLHASGNTRAELFLLAPSSSNSQTVVSLGIRHLF